jgi:hypothetical protein
MNWTRSTRQVGFVLVLALSLLAVTVLWVTMGRAAPASAPTAQGGAPTVVSYQGEVRMAGSPYAGAGHFKFSVVNAAGDTTYWSNDGSGAGGNEPSAAVALDVSNGIFSVLLGDTALGGMTQSLDAGVFAGAQRYLRVWFSPTGLTGSFARLEPDTRIAAVPYALQAQAAASVPWSGVTGEPAFQQKVAQLVIVAKSGGDYAAVQSAVDAVSDASADNPYLIWVAPGVYSETVRLKPYVHLQGAGEFATIITSTQSADSNLYPTQATLVLTRNVTLRHLTVGNSGAGAANVAILAMAGTTETLLADLTAQTQGVGENNFGIVLSGGGTCVTVRDVDVLGAHASDANVGLSLRSNAQAILHGGVFVGRGGIYAYGISANGGDTLEAEGVTAVAEGGNSNYGLAASSATVSVRSGAFSARGGNYARGISNYMASLTATSITALGENATYGNYGLANGSGPAVLYGGSFTGRGGQDAYGIENRYNGTYLEARGITARAQNGANANYGLLNTHTAMVKADGCQLIGATDAVRQGGGAISIGVSLLNGGASLVQGTETLNCFQVYGPNYTAYSCP